MNMHRPPTDDLARVVERARDGDRAALATVVARLKDGVRMRHSPHAGPGVRYAPIHAQAVASGLADRRMLLHRVGAAVSNGDKRRG